MERDAELTSSATIQLTILISQLPNLDHAERAPVAAVEHDHVWAVSEFGARCRRAIRALEWKVGKRLTDPDAVGWHVLARVQVAVAQDRG